MTIMHELSNTAIALEELHTAHNYAPLPVVAASAEAPGSPMWTAAATWTAWPPTPR